MFNIKFFLALFALFGILTQSCTTDGLCKTDADCCEHYICKAWYPDGYHCMTGCQPNGGTCKDVLDCCDTAAVCTKGICRHGHEVEKKVDDNSTAHSG